MKLIYFKRGQGEGRVLWLRHGVDEWHFDCRPQPGGHEYIAAARRKREGWTLEITGRSKRVFDTVGALNAYLEAVGLQRLDIDEEG